MSASSPLVCRRCGFTNVPGDQFCGSCGAFLEWEGEQVPADGGGSTHGDPDVPVVGGGPGRGTPGGGDGPTERVPTGSPGTAGEPGPAWGGAGVVGAAAGGTAPGAGAAGDLVRCPSCGIANAATRTFCQSCGTRLADASPVTTVTRERVVDAVNRPVTVTTTTIRSARPEPDRGSGGGVLRWILVMAVLGILVGAGVVLAANALRGEGPGSGATSAPASASAGAVSPAASGEPGTSAVAGSEAPTSSPRPAAKPERLALLGASASSVVGDREKFQAIRAIDGDPATCWQEGRATEKGEWIEVVFAPSKVTALVITNGYNASRALYRGNRRLKDVEIRVGDAAPVTVRLKDTGEPQRVDVKNVPGAVAVRITIVSTYPSVATSVEGTPFDDAALGEIVVLGVPGG